MTQTAAAEPAKILEEKTELLTHVHALDGLRALAAIAVIVEHIYQDRHAVITIRPGYVGVRLFFVLSGFLITSILLRGNRPAGKWFFLKAFYLRRSLRIFPVYYLFLFAMLICSLKAHGLQGHYAWRFAYLSNWNNVIHNSGDGLFGHLWSLSVEEQFYLIWPSIILFTPRRFLLPVIVASAVLGPAGRVASVLLHANGLWVHEATWCCADSLGAGAVLAYLNAAKKLGSIANYLWLPGVLGVPIWAYGIYSGYVHQADTVLSVICIDGGIVMSCFAIVGLCLVRDNTWYTRMLSLRPLTHMGKISYGVYLFHIFIWTCIGVVLAHIFGPRQLLTPAVHLDFIFTVGISVGVATLSWRWFESPLNNLKRFFPYRQESDHGTQSVSSK